MLNYTKNYQLPQWVESDRVLMEDFNDAMAKVDQEILQANEKNPLQELTRIPAQKAEEALEVSWVDWERFRAIHIYFNLKFSESNVTGKILLNDLSGNFTYLLSSSNGQDHLASMATNSAKQCTGVLQLIPGGVGFLGIYDCVGQYPRHGETSCQGVTRDTLTTINFHLTATPTDGEYIFYGLLK